MRLAKILFIFFLTFQNIFCFAKESKETDRNLLLLGILYNQQYQIYEPANCQLSYQLNSSYVPGGFAERFLSDFKQYENSLLGDSTATIYSTFEGFLDTTNTQNNAVPGDMLCDYRSRFKKSIRIAPKHIVISTVGGNDLLSKRTNSTIIETFDDLHKSLRSWFPNTKLSYVEVHKTFVEYANLNRKIISSAMRTRSQDACWVDPDVCFSNPLSESEMLDAIHPNKTPAVCIKELLRIQCGVLL